MSLHRVATLPLLLGLLGCASEPTEADGAGSGGLVSTGGSAGNATGGGGGTSECGPASGQPPVCEGGPGYADSRNPVLIDSVSAVVVDQDGAPAPDLLVQVCGTDVCINGTTNGEGIAAVAVGVEIRKPAFKYGTGLDFARLAFLIDEVPDQDLGTVTGIRLPAFAEGSPICPGSAAASAGVTLAVDAPASIAHDTLVYGAPEQRTFRAAAIPLAGPLFDEALGLELAYALAPVETKFCPPARLSLPNDAGLAPDSAVEFLAIGVDILEAWASYAEWTKVSDGVVSTDGSRIQMTGEGIAILYAAVGVRQRP